MTDNFLFFPCSIDFFKDVGQVVRVRLLLNARGKHVGYGFVEFASSNQAKMVRVVFSSPDERKKKYLAMHSFVFLI